MKSYTMYLYHNDERIFKNKLFTDDIQKIYHDMSYKLIINGLKNNISIDKQISTYKIFMDKIYKMKINCYKIRASDLLMYCSCFFALHKMNQVSPDDCIIIKNKYQN